MSKKIGKKVGSSRKSRVALMAVIAAVMGLALAVVYAYVSYSDSATVNNHPSEYSLKVESARTGYHQRVMTDIDDTEIRMQQNIINLSALTQRKGAP